MKHALKVLALGLTASLLLPACKKDKKTDDTTETPVVTTPTPSSTGTMKISFNNQVDGAPLEFGKSYTNASGEAYTVSKFSYYISNIVLTKTDNSLVNVNLYQIISHAADTSKTMTLPALPEGSYTSIKLMLGVDSASNRSGSHTGGLDFSYASDMFWSWNQGYIFMKFEGKSAASSTGDVTYHIGGFGGANKSQRNFVFNFTDNLVITKSSTPILTLNVNVSEVFKNPNTLSFAVLAGVMSPGTAQTKLISDNYADMITFGSLKN